MVFRTSSEVTLRTHVRWYVWRVHGHHSYGRIVLLENALRQRANDRIAAHAIAYRWPNVTRDLVKTSLRRLSSDEVGAINAAIEKDGLDIWLATIPAQLLDAEVDRWILNGWYGR